MSSCTANAASTYHVILGLSLASIVKTSSFVRFKNFNSSGSPCITTQTICLSLNHVKSLDTSRVLSIMLVIPFASKLFLQTTVKFYTVPYYAQHLTQIIRTSEPCLSSFSLIVRMGMIQITLPHFLIYSVAMLLIQVFC